MATMDHSGRSAAADDGSLDDQQKYLYLHKAWLLQEKLNDLIDNGNCPGLELQTMLDLAASQRVISYDPRMMSPARWRNLPKKLLENVFARLPLPDISRLRRLSRNWGRDMATPNSEFIRACAEAHPNLVALLSRSGDRDNEFRVRLFDFSKNIWQHSYNFRLRDINEDGWNLMEAHDGGLVCLVSNWKITDANPLAIVVMNLLTRVQHELPNLLYSYSFPPTMVQIKVNPETKCYKVFVIRQTKVRLTVEVYDSGMKKWTKGVTPDVIIFGLADEWRPGNNGRHELVRRTGCAFDSATHTLVVYEPNRLLRRRSDIFYAIEMDREFVLHEVVQIDLNDDGSEVLPEVFCISEYRAQNNARDWVQVGTHDCPVFGNYSRNEYYNMLLHASDGILMVIISSAGRQHCWHLNLSTGVWCELPEYISPPFPTIMCKAHWNIVP